MYRMSTQRDCWQKCRVKMFGWQLHCCSSACWWWWVQRVWSPRSICAASWPVCWWRPTDSKRRSCPIVSIFLSIFEVWEIIIMLNSLGICLVEHESSLDTNKVTSKENNSKNYGLFQINSRDYCAEGRRGGLCNMKCEGRQHNFSYVVQMRYNSEIFRL